MKIRLENRFGLGIQAASQVVGVLGDIKNDSLATATQPEVVLPYTQLASPTLYITLIPQWTRIA